MTVVVNDESKHSTFSRINIVICFIPCGGPTVICFIPCGSRAADPLDGHRNLVGEATALLSVLCSSRSTWLANSPTFGRVPVSAVSGTGAASLPEQLNNLMPAPCQRYWTGIQPECSAPIHFFWNKVGLKMCFLLLILNLRGLGCRERCQMLDLEEGQYLASIYLVSYMT
ncbi:hypothetical protein J6590_040064 [Homalodisca vitripennis]|nr:hypothetical protein J6590_040064 [Homalodisca vitripennis]